jgi:hypothetical protein
MQQILSQYIKYKFYLRMNYSIVIYLELFELFLVNKLLFRTKGISCSQKRRSSGVEV